MPVRSDPRVLVGLLAACYAPHPGSGAPCDDAARCPTGQRCRGGHCSAELDGSVEGQGDASTDPPPGDAPPGEVPPGDAPASDAPPSDASSSACQSAETCASASVFGAVSGDTGAQVVATAGHRAAWRRLRVTEDYRAITPRPLRVLVELTVPGGADFDVVLHVNTTVDAPECVVTVGTTTMSGTTKQVRFAWGELGPFANSLDDSRDVTLEIRPVSGACAPDQRWQLEVAGNRS